MASYTVTGQDRIDLFYLLYWILVHMGVWSLTITLMTISATQPTATITVSGTIDPDQLSHLGMSLI